MKLMYCQPVTRWPEPESPTGITLSTSTTPASPPEELKALPHLNRPHICCYLFPSRVANIIDCHCCSVTFLSRIVNSRIHKRFVV